MDRGVLSFCPFPSRPSPWYPLLFLPTPPLPPRDHSLQGVRYGEKKFTSSFIPLAGIPVCWFGQPVFSVDPVFVLLSPPSIGERSQVRRALYLPGELFSLGVCELPILMVIRFFAHFFLSLLASDSHSPNDPLPVFPVFIGNMATLFL